MGNSLFFSSPLTTHRHSFSSHSSTRSFSTQASLQLHLRFNFKAKPYRRRSRYLTSSTQDDFCKPSFTMRFTTGIAAVAAAAGAHAQIEGTTTMTSTTTMTKTVTQCNPTATDCPLWHTTPSVAAETPSIVPETTTSTPEP